MMNQALVLKFNSDHIRYRDQAFNINIFRTKVPIYDQFKKVNTKYFKRRWSLDITNLKTRKTSFLRLI